MHRAIASASSLVVHTWALDPEAPHDAAAAAALLRTLCEGLAEAHVLADGDAPFVQLCAHELRAAMEALQSEHGGGEHSCLTGWLAVRWSAARKGAQQAMGAPLKCFMLLEL